MFLVDLFIAVVYQPLFNVLILFYWLLDRMGSGPADMGIAVILLTFVVRLLLLPLSLSGDQTESERRRIAAQLKELEVEFAHDPVGYQKGKKKIMRRNGRIIAGEIFSFSIQMIISLVLWRIFSTGLSGEDLHYIYSFMPKVQLPFNLIFLGKFDLSHPSLVLNLTQSFLIFILETLSMLTSPYPVSRNEVVRMQLTLPLVSFIIFLQLPAGKKLFICTTLIISIILTSFKFIKRKFLDYKEKVEEAEGKPAEEQIVVDVK